MPFGPASHEKPASINQVLIESTLVIPRSPPRRTARNLLFSRNFQAKADPSSARKMADSG
jgi:hypothetical protein